MGRFLSPVAISLLLVSLSPGARAAESPPVRSAEALEITVLPRPSFDRRGASRETGSHTLEIVEAKPSRITDDKKWLESNGLSLPRFDLDNLPSTIPRTFRGNPLVQALYDSDSTLLLYGRDYSGARYVVAQDSTGAFRYAFDFASFLTVPGVKTDELTEEPVTWAVEERGVLYVANGHRTYAASSKGRNAYLTAIDIRTGRILWRSRPLVANASSFAIVGDVIATGYGFTKEPDFLYLIDKKAGDIVAKQPLKSGPDYVLLKDMHLFVRAYDTNYVFRILQRKGAAAWKAHQD